MTKSKHIKYSKQPSYMKHLSHQ